MLNTSFFQKILFVIGVFLFCSCDKDYNVIGDDLIGDNNFDFATYYSNVVAYNQKITAVANNQIVTATNSPLNRLGIYEDPVFGTVTSNFVTQVSLSTYAPTIGEAPVIEDVILEIPYFSHVTEVNVDGSSDYELDSIYGGAPDEAKLNLKIYESGYYLRDLDPNTSFQESQLYYTDQNAEIDSWKKGAILNNDANESQNTAFFFDKSQIVIKTIDADTQKETTTYKAPQMRLKLDKAFFQDKILNASASYLATSDVFKNYFRGLYFQVDRSGSSKTNMAMLDFSKGTITIKYKAKTAITTDDDQTMEDKSIVLTLTGNTVGLQDESASTVNYTSATNPNNVDKVQGDEKLYLRGGEGSMAVISLFDTPGELEQIRSKGWLINEANLTFYIDADQMKNSDEPNRVYLYDLTNNQPIVDFYNDGTGSVTTDANLSKIIFSGIIVKDASSSKGVYYKIRLTDHIRNLIKTTTAENVKLGLVVTQSISTTGFNKLRTPNDVLTAVPKASVVSPLGTVVYGGSTSVSEDKRLRLKIYYTKSN